MPYSDFIMLCSAHFVYERGRPSRWRSAPYSGFIMLCPAHFTYTKVDFFQSLRLTVSVFNCLVSSTSLKVVGQVVPSIGEVWRVGGLIFIFYWLGFSNDSTYENFPYSVYTCHDLTGSIFYML